MGRNTQENRALRERGVELDNLSPDGYAVLRAVASDGKMVASIMTLVELDTPRHRQTRIDRLWAAIEEYEAMGRASTRPSLFLT